MTLEYLGRNVSGFVFILLSSYGIGVLMFSLLRRVIKENAIYFSVIETYLLISASGLGLSSLIILLLGLIGYLYTIVGYLLVGFGIGIFLYYKVINQDHRFVIFPQKKSISSLFLPRVNVVFMLFWLGEVLYTLVTNVLMPPHEWDELAYHLALPKLYINYHKLIYVPYIIQSNWPLGTEMMFTWGLLLGSEMACHLLTWWMAVITTIWLFVFGKNFLCYKLGIFGGILFLMIPLVRRLSGTGLIDVSLAYYGIAAWYCFNKFMRTKSILWLIYSGLFSGFAAGSKLTGLALVFLLSILLVGTPTIQNLELLQKIRLIGIVFTLGLLFVLPWYVRSFINTGNPIYPFFF